MKHTINTLLALLLVLVVVSSLGACSTPAETPSTGTTDSDTSNTEQAGIWGNATYLEDIEFGTGSKDVVVEIVAENKMVTLTVHTDKQTVGEALEEHDLLQGEEGAYGLYVKTVNGITADYDVDQHYWAFYINGEYAMTGVDSTDITEGTIYRLEYAK